MPVADNLYVNNDYFIEVGPLTGFSLVDGTEVLMTGWADLKAKLCATDAWDAVAINAALDVPLTEEGVLAVYRGKFEGSALSTYLANVTYLDTVIYLHLYRLQDYHVVSPVTVRGSRVVD